MGCGKKAAYEEAYEEQHFRKVEQYSKKDAVDILFELEKVEDALNQFERSNPSLTKSQWFLINRISEITKKLLK
jgi:hypothetical protein